MKNFHLLFACAFIYTHLSGQDSTGQIKAVTWSVFADIYYTYDFNNPPHHEKPSFLYNHNRHNEVNVNLALLKISYNKERIRANAGLMAGTYAQYNLASEPELLRHLYETNIGVKISRKMNFWIDAGLLPSHIGFETVITNDNWTLTRSIAAENSPYYETGIKFTYTAAEKILISGLILNGWQRIRRPDNNNTPALGTQLTISPTDKIIFNWSTFIGNDKPDSARQMRFFNNLYTIINFDEKLGITAGFDIGWQQRLNSEKNDRWFSPILILRFIPDKKWAWAIRAEYYSDPDAVIIVTGTPNGFRTWGVSLNVDRRIFDQVWWRTEFRILKSKDAIFLRGNSFQNNHTAITTSLAVSF